MSQIYPDYAYNNPIQRGEIFLSTYIGEGYLEKLRPVVVIQNNLGNKHSRSIIVAAVTSKPKKELPVNVVIDPNKYDLEVDNCTIIRATEGSIGLSINWVSVPEYKRRYCEIKFFRPALFATGYLATSKGIS